MTETSQPLYLQIHLRLLHAISSSGSLKNRMIKESVLARHFGVSREPVRRALEMLEEENLIEATGSQGFHIIEQPNTSAGSDTADETTKPESIFDLLPGAVERSSSALKIYSRVESDVINQAVLGDFAIVTTQLAEHYDISRTVAKEVLTILKSNGIVQQSSSGKWLIPKLSERSVTDTNGIRLRLEPFAIESAALTIPSSLVKLQLALHKKSELIDAGELTAVQLSALEKGVHETILAHCGNTRLVELLKLCSIVQSFNANFYEKFGSDFTFIPEHIEILEAIEARDPQAAAISLSHHISLSTKKTINRLNQYREMHDGKLLPFASIEEDA